jgi:hypothetical protein
MSAMPYDFSGHSRFWAATICVSRRPVHPFVSAGTKLRFGDTTSTTLSLKESFFFKKKTSPIRQRIDLHIAPDSRREIALFLCDKFEPRSILQVEP